MALPYLRYRVVLKKPGIITLPDDRISSTDRPGTLRYLAAQIRFLGGVDPAS